MEDLVLALICQELEIEEDFLLSDRKFKKISYALSLMTYILVTNCKMTVAEVIVYYNKKGLNRTRTSLYHHLKVCTKRDKTSDDFRFVHESIINSLSIAEEQGIVDNGDRNNHEAKGRLISKIVCLENISNVFSIEKQVDSLLKAEFINETQFKETKAWVTYPSRTC